MSGSDFYGISYIIAILVEYQDDDWHTVKGLMVHVIQNILVDNVPALSKTRHVLSKHLAHQMSTEMSMQSNVINLGALDANPSKTSGLIQATYLLL